MVSSKAQLLVRVPRLAVNYSFHASLFLGWCALYVCLHNKLNHRNFLCLLHFNNPHELQLQCRFEDVCCHSLAIPVRQYEQLMIN